MLVVEYTSISIGAASADLFSNIGGSADLQIKSLWSYIPDRDIRLSFEDGVPDAADYTLQVGDLTLEFPEESSGNSSFKWTDVDVDWEDGQTISVRIVQTSALEEPAANTPATGEPAISGTAQVDQTLTANTSAIADEDGLDDVSYSYQWTRSDNGADTDIAGETDSTYTLVLADQGKTIKVKVSFTDDADNDETLTSEPTEVVTAAPNRAATGEPTISGTPQVDQTLTASTSAIADQDGLDGVSYNYQWIADDTDIQDATDSTYTPSVTDVGNTIKVKVSFTDDRNNAEARTSLATTAVLATVPTQPLSLTVATGDEIQELDASWQAPSSNGGSAVTGYKVQWKEAADSWDTEADVSEATETGTTHTVTGLTGGVEYAVRVMATNDVGDGPASTEAKGTPAGGVSEQTVDPENTVEPENSVPTGLPTISGTPQVGVELSADTSAMADGDGLTNVSYSYQWIAGGSDISGATASSYTLRSSEEGQTIQVRVSFTDDGDNMEELTSEPTGAVAPVNNPAAGVPIINGIPRVGETLTVDVSGISDADGMENATFSYSWYARDNSDEQFFLSASFVPYYVVQSRYEGMRIRVGGYFTDDAGNHETLTTAATVAVAAAANPTVPEAPAHRRVGPPLGVAPQGSGELEVSWTGPGYPYGDGGSVITGGKVQWKEAADSWDSDADVSEALIPGDCSLCRYTITGLTNGVAYTARVFVTNAIGDSPPSDELTSTPTNGTTLTLSGITKTNYPEDEGCCVVPRYTVTGAQAAITWSVSGDDSDAFSISIGGSLRFTRWGSYENPTDADRDNQYQVTVQASDGTNMATLQVVVVVISRGRPIINGDAQVGQPLTADTLGITDADGLHNPNFTYQWISNDGTMDSDIAGATAFTHTLTDSEEGKTIKVKVSFTDDAGNQESLTSGATEAVTRPPPSRAPEMDGISIHDGMLRISAASLPFSDSNPPSSVPAADVGEYIASFKVQWKSGSQEYDASRQAVVAPEPVTANVAFYAFMPAYDITGLTNDVEYTVRVIATNAGGDGPPSQEQTATPGTKSEELWKYIEDEIVEEHEASHQWLRQTLNYLRNNNIPLIVWTDASDPDTVETYSDDSSELDPGYVESLNFPVSIVDGPEATKKETILINLAYIYTMTNGVSSSPAPLGIAHVYFSKSFLNLVSTNGACWESRLYLDVVVSLVLDDSLAGSSDWNRCMARSEDATALAVVRSALSGQTPAWFADTYNDSEGNPDLDRLWSGVQIIGGGHERVVAYQLRNSFGAYCDSGPDWGLRISRSLSRALASAGFDTLVNPWRDGGCVPSAPISLTANLDGDGAASVSWEAPESNGGSLLSGYRIQWQSVDAEEGTTPQTKHVYFDDYSDEARPTEVSETIDGLTDGVDYTVRVLAYNPNGDGTAAEVTVSEPNSDSDATDTLPVAPTGMNAVASDDGMQLSWDAVDGNVLRYEVLRQRPRECEESLTVLVSDTGEKATAYTDGTVVAGVQYIYAVRAVNDAGVGPRSGGVVVRHVTSNDGTRAGVPAAPTNLRTYVTRDGIELEWRSAEDSTITGYQILRRVPSKCESKPRIHKEDTGSTETEALGR